MDDKPIEFKIVVNGQAVEVKASTFDEIREAVEQALKDSGNSGQPLADWELRDASGQAIDLGKKIGELGIEEGATLFLNLKAGVGGNRA